MGMPSEAACMVEQFIMDLNYEEKIRHFGPEYSLLLQIIFSIFQLGKTKDDIIPN